MKEAINEFEAFSTAPIRAAHNTDSERRITIKVRESHGRLSLFSAFPIAPWRYLPPGAVS